jgi:hypothetical protein
MRRPSVGKAIAYTAGLWTGFVRFLENPKIPLDTSGVEPRAYLGEAARQAIRCPGAVTLARDFK